MTCPDYLPNGIYRTIFSVFEDLKEGKTFSGPESYELCRAAPWQGSEKGIVRQGGRQVPDTQNGDEALIIATEGGENPPTSGQIVTGPPPRISASAHGSL
jgi:hypothetical protein